MRGKRSCVESQLGTNPWSRIKPELPQLALPIEAPGCGTERYRALISGSPEGSQRQEQGSGSRAGPYISAKERDREAGLPFLKCGELAACAGRYLQHQLWLPPGSCLTALQAL